MTAPLLNRGELAAIKTRSILRIGARHHTTQRREPANLTGILWLDYRAAARCNREGVCPSPSALPADVPASSAGDAA
jgi:hypothetical protein